MPRSDETGNNCKDHDINEWKACFQEGPFVKQDPIRMIFNDSVSFAAPIKRPEGRPLRPLYFYEITHISGKLQGINLRRTDEFSSERWARLTAIRQPAASDLTEWEPGMPLL